MPGETESLPLLAPNSSTAFAQQGQVDWTTLGKNTVRFTVGALSRLSKAGVEALTIYAARAIFHQVKLDQLGEQRVVTALEGLRAFSSYNRALFFCLASST
jgi:hypothetical protein